MNRFTSSNFACMVFEPSTKNTRSIGVAQFNASVGEVLGDTEGLVDGDDGVGDTLGDIVGDDTVGGSVGDIVGLDCVGDVDGALEGLDVTGSLVGLDVDGDTDVVDVGGFVATQHECEQRD